MFLVYLTPCQNMERHGFLLQPTAWSGIVFGQSSENVNQILAVDWSALEYLVLEICIKILKNMSNKLIGVCEKLTRLSNSVPTPAEIKRF